MTQQNLSQQTMEAAKQLAPWSTRLPWWVVLIEGLVLGGLGLYTVLNPAGANVTLVLVLCFGLVVAGLTQLWSVLRNHVPERVDSLVAARGAVAVYAGLAIIILYFIEGALTRVAGFGIFGSAALVYGVLALFQVFGSEGNMRRQALVELLLFGSVGLVTLWGLYAGGENIVTAVRVIGWIFLIAGVALIGLAIWRWQKGDEADQVIDATTAKVSAAADSVTSLGRTASTEAKQSAADAAAKVDEVTKDVTGEGE